MSRTCDKNKSYGLIIPGEERVKKLQQQQQQKQKQQLARPSIFDDSDSDGEAEAKFDAKFAKKFDPRRAALEASGNSRLKSSTRADIDKCLAEDPSIFEYDSIYDQITEKRPRDTAGVKTVSDRAPKYIGGLMRSAGERKMEREYQRERMIQAEREAEGELYADKEAFVTSAYKKKLAEFSELERQHKLQEAKDARQDAAKQQDLTGFYRNLLDHGRKRQPEEPAPVAAQSQPPAKPSSASSKFINEDSRDRYKNRHQERHAYSQTRRHRRSRSRSGSASSDDAAAAPSSTKAGDAVLDPLLLVKLRRRNNADAVSDARQRYLQRRGVASSAAAPPIVPDSDNDDA